MEWVDHRNLPDRPPASAILNSLEKSQPLVVWSVGIRCEPVHIGRILIRIVSNTAGTPSHQPSRLVHGHHALRRVGARARNAAAAPPSKDTNFRRPILTDMRPLCARPPNLGNYTTQRICGLRVPRVGCYSHPLRPQCSQWVKSVVLTLRRSLPIYPDKQTFTVSVGMSQKCLNSHTQAATR